MKHITNFLNFFRIIYRSLFIPRLPFQKTKKGRILVLGTGPSINQNYSVINEKRATTEIIALNDFAFDNHFEELRPEYYMCIDPAYWEKEELCYSVDVANRKKLFTKLISETTWRMIFFLPSRMYQYQNIRDLFTRNKNLVLKPINIYNIPFTNNSKYYHYLQQNYISPTQNVAAAAIYASINMGYTEIGICGADHDWTIDLRVNNQNEVCTIKKHCYSSEEKLEPWHMSNGKIFTMDEILRVLSITFRDYRILRQYADMKKVRIYNYTPNSFIDAFDRNNIDSLGFPYNAH